MKRRYAVVAGGTAVGAALLVSGCTGSGDDKGATTDNMKLTAAQALDRTSQKTGEADTFKADLTATGTGNGGGKIHATGQFKLRPTLVFSAQLDDFAAGGQSVPGAKGQAIFTGDVLYAKVPQLARFVANGKPWVKVDVNKMSQTTGFDVKSLINQVQQVNPAEQTKMFTGSKDVRRVGEESVDGTKTTHYAGTVTVQDALNRLDPSVRQRVQAWLPQRDAANQKISFDLWTDKSGLPRKLESKGDHDGKTGSVTVLYSDYGKNFGVNPPPSDQVGELSLNGLLNGATHN